MSWSHNLLTSVDDRGRSRQFRGICVYGCYSSHAIRRPDSCHRVSSAAPNFTYSSSIGSSFFLKERLSFVGKVGTIMRRAADSGCTLCIIGATIIVMKYLQATLPLTQCSFSESGDLNTRNASIRYLPGLSVIRRSPHPDLGFPHVLGWPKIRIKGIISEYTTANLSICSCTSPYVPSSDPSAWSRSRD